MIGRIAKIFGVEVLAIALGLGLTIVLLSPGSSDAIELSAYLGLSALISFIVVEILIRAGVLASRMRLKYKITLAAGIGAGLAFLNAFAMSALMFVNTEHDLPMLLAILVFAAVIAGYAAVRMSSSISGSISILADRARRLSAGDLSVRMP